MGLAQETKVIISGDVTTPSDTRSYKSTIVMLEAKMK